MTQQLTRSLTELYGYAYLKAEEAGARPGVTWLIYQASDGIAFAEDVVNYFAPPQGWWQTDVLACEQARGRVLDIGCGAGRHALLVAQAGHEVVGLEPSRDAVTVARRRGIDARCGGLPDLPDGLGTFDTFLLVGGGLHLLTLGDESGTALERLAAAANPGACVVGTMVTEPGEQAETYRIRVQHEGRLTEWSEWSSAGVAVSPDDLADLADGTGWVVEHIQHREQTYPADIVSAEQLQAMDRDQAWTPPESASQPQPLSSFLARLRLTGGQA
ncbi:class I SAM-dependent methyltransferase [Nocardia transvalensis]|uniref:class I SAM-dependent methyltransferase n=1 Tax=Nocardia transvalensis TaxID=37333 RepID=UPI001892E91A|nr:class I SAM-dependent methyltransferase [Nocardia transvalensis]MBF6329824.1 class I SAM-dependent methyltransferase [Nocardia transvalensis]